MTRSLRRSGDRGAHGIFDEESRICDPRFWATKNRGRLGALAGAGLAGVAYAFLRRNR